MPKLIILPGWGGTKQSWKNFAEHAQEFFDVEIIELSCFGDEPCPTDVWGVEEYADFVKSKILNHKSKIILLGHSFGGQVATYLTANNPELIDKLILSGAAVYRPKKSFKRMFFAILAKCGNVILTLPGLNKLKTIARKALHKAAQTPDYGKTSGIQKDIYKKIIRQDLSHLLPQIKTETLVVWGDHDSYVPLKYGRKIANELPNATLKIIKDGTHGLHIKKINELLTNIRTFIT